MKILSVLYVSLACIGLIGCGKGVATEAGSEMLIDSAHAVAFEGKIDSGVIYTNSENANEIRGQIYNQLLYTVGQLNGENAVGDINSLTVNILETTDLFPNSPQKNHLDKNNSEDGKPVENADEKVNDELSDEDQAKEDNSNQDPTDPNYFRYQIKYEALFTVAWPLETADDIPDSYELIIPKAADNLLLEKFLEKAGGDGLRCYDRVHAHPEELSTGILWYYYRPQSCDSSLVENYPEYLSLFNMTFYKSAANTQGKYPEYHMVWEDGELEATLIFGKNEEGSMETSDAGVAAYNETYTLLLEKFGTPVEISENYEKYLGIYIPGPNYPELYMAFDTPFGKLKINMFLIDGIRNVDDAFKDKYNQLTETSDYVSYSGHSGLGRNIRELATLGRFVPGKYQIFLINGCDTFAYVDNALKRAHAEVNPGEPANRYFDIITNAMPSYFKYNAESNMAIVNGLVEGTATYREILSGFDRRQRALVMGEEDNIFHPNTHEIKRRVN